MNDTTALTVQNMAVASFGETAPTGAAATARALVEARYLVAFKRPRNWDEVRQNILKECRRPGFAHNASVLYNKPIGKGVEGLGIRFVEMAVRWIGNMQVSTSTVYEDEAKEIVNVCVTDFESNVPWDQDITVRKTVERSKPLDDGTYISVRTNSYGKPVYTVPATDEDLLNKRGALISKAVRTLGLRLIPGDIQDEAEALIRKIRMDQAAEDPDAERKRIIDAFGSINVRASDLVEYVGHDIAQCSPAELVKLRGLYGAIRDGQATWADTIEAVRVEREESTTAKINKEIRGTGAIREGQEINKEIRTPALAASATHELPPLSPKLQDHDDPRKRGPGRPRKTTEEPPADDGPAPSQQFIENQIDSSKDPDNVYAAAAMIHKGMDAGTQAALRDRARARLIELGYTPV